MLKEWNWSKAGRITNPGERIQGTRKSPEWCGKIVCWWQGRQCQLEAWICYFLSLSDVILWCKFIISTSSLLPSSATIGGTNISKAISSRLFIRENWQYGHLLLGQSAIVDTYLFCLCLKLTLCSSPGHKSLLKEFTLTASPPASFALCIMSQIRLFFFFNLENSLQLLTCSFFLSVPQALVFSPYNIVVSEDKCLTG